jgi:hypothetical protein
MIAKKDPAFQEASETLYVMNSDETIRAQCRAREDYYWMERSRQKEHERVLAELDVANSKVTELMQYITDHGLPLPEDK